MGGDVVTRLYRVTRDGRTDVVLAVDVWAAVEAVATSRGWADTDGVQADVYLPEGDQPIWFPAIEAEEGSPT